MTAIAWDGKTLAADKRAGSAAGFTSVTTKIFALNDALVAISGTLHVGMQMVAWYKAGANVDEFPEAQIEDETRCGFTVIDKNGKCYSYENSPYPIHNTGKFYADGCARECAMTVMYLGFDARRAVEIACELNSGCGNGIDTLTLDDLKKKKGKKK